VADDKSIDLSVPRGPTDIYAFGMVIYELLTGKVPFDHMTNQFIKEAVVDRNERPDLTQFESRYPERSQSALVDLLKQCWEADYMARPDINDILRLLVRLLKLNGGDPRDNRMETLPREFQLLQLEDEVESAKVGISLLFSFP
jgi:serine/threonine protein kinase